MPLTAIYADFSGNKTSKHRRSYPFTVTPQHLTELRLSMMRFFRDYDWDGWENSQKFRKGLFLNLPELQLKFKWVKLQKKTKHNHKPTTQLRPFFLGAGRRAQDDRPQVLYFFEIILKFFIKVIVAVRGITSALRKFALGFLKKDQISRSYSNRSH